LLVPVTVLPRPPPGSIHIQLSSVLEPIQTECGCTHQTRQRCVFRREGVCVDRSAINLDTSTVSRSPEQTFGRFSFRGPSRLARKMTVRGPRLTCTQARVKTYPKGSGHFSATTRAMSNEARPRGTTMYVRSTAAPQVRAIATPPALASWPPHLFKFHHPVLKPSLPSLSIGATDCAAIENPYSIEHEFIHRLRAPRAHRLLLRQNYPRLKFLRGHS
jgi:hypothetical protein